MRISGSLPMHVARAYGAAVPRAPHGPQAAAAPSKAVTGLVAGTVARGAEFTPGSAPLASSADAFALYTRAADKVEAATAVQVGRALDVKG